jgi:hypothetical protein
MAPERNIEVDSNQSTPITTDESIIVDVDPINPLDGETIHAYPEPVAKLFIFGEPEGTTIEDWPDYLATGITVEHTPDLLRMIADRTLRTNDPEEEDPKYWAPIHAWRALGQLRDASAIEPLLQQTEDLFDNKLGFGDWAIEELPDVYANIGEAAIPILTRCIADPTWTVNTRIQAMTGLTTITQKYPEHREETIVLFVQQLEQFVQNDPELNGYLITNLAILKAVDTLPLIQQAFASNNVDTFLISLEDVEVAFGLKERSTPEFTDWESLLRNFSQSAGLDLDRKEEHTHTHQHSTRSVSPPRGSKNKVTKKAKAKMEKKSRKHNHGK